MRGCIGSFHVPQELTVDSYLTAREHLNYYADLYHLTPSIREARIQELLALMGLAEDADRRAKHFSGGMKKKLDLACGLIHQPPLIFLDEPSLGLDVQVRRDVWNYILRLKERGTTVFLCTNYMDEAERASRVGLMNRGRIIALGDPATLKSGMEGEILEVVAEPQAAAKRALRDHPLVRSLEVFGDRLHVLVPSADVARQLAATLGDVGVNVSGIRVIPPSLEDVFVSRLGVRTS